MSIERTLMVLGTPIRVIEREPDDHGVAGSTDWLKGEIVIASGLSDRAKVMVYWHELLHAALEATGLGASLTAEQNEAICDGLGHAILRILSDNPTHPLLQHTEEPTYE
jgi:hypothetical protein